ncbi:hypothetical protein CVT25_005555 [Psilocybe cyanescens]|uniref:CHAT domain-containing protein n=1 Tax=Psilocybe cyanescens TaxID=93625 RepID=A0A409XRX4_PSICY|nr:hypothetical protein CVT25_005555 [Psilocybe cyanescens]
MDVPLVSTVDQELGEAISGLSLAENPTSESLLHVEPSMEESNEVLIANIEIDSKEMQRQLFDVARNEHEKFNESRSMEDLNRTINLYCSAISKIPEDNDLHLMALFSLSLALQDRFRQGGQLRDLDQSIALNQWVRDHCSPTDSDQLFYLDNLATGLQIRFIQTKQIEDLNEEIKVCRDILELDTVPLAIRHLFLRQLARALESRFETNRERIDLDEAISLYRKCVERISSDPSHADLPLSLRRLASALGHLYEETSHENNLDEAILLLRRTLELHDSTTGQCDSLHNLAYMLKIRFGHSGQPQDLEESIKLHRQTLDFASEHGLSRSSMRINNLANAILVQFAQTDQESDLTEAILMFKEAWRLESEVSGPPRESDYMVANNLAIALMYRFELTGQQDDLDESILLHRRNLERLPAKHPRRHDHLANLANSLCTLVKRTGHRGALDEAISIYRQAFELFPTLHPTRSQFLNNLGQALSMRFKQTGQQSDHEEALALHKEALKLQHGSHPSRAQSLNLLANTLVERGPVGDSQIDERRVEEAISLYREALELHDSAHSSRPSVLSGLGGALLNLFNRTKNGDYIDEAVLRYREGLALVPSSSPYQPLYISELAHAFRVRYIHTGSVEDFAQATALNYKAIELFPSAHRYRYHCFTDLGHLFVRASILHGSPPLLEKAISSFRLALESASHSASIMHGIADSWSFYASDHEHSSTLEAYDAALESLCRMASLSLDIYSRQRIIQTARNGSATRAACYAIRKGHFDKAIEFLEGGRAIFWSQALHLRTSFDRLRDKAPELAHRLQSIVTELEHASYRSTLSTDWTLDNKSKMSIEVQEARFRRLDEEWSNSLNEARNIPGFEYFLQTPRLTMLQAAAAECPVVFLVPSEEYSDCLIMTATTIHHIHLTSMSEETLRNLINMTKLACSKGGASRSTCNEGDNASLYENVDMQGDLVLEEMARSKGAFGGRRSKPSSNNLFEYILKTLWLEVVKPVIEILSLPKLESPQALKWCPTGLLSFLPIHAAGCYNPDHGALECASDYMISSYTPTLGMLLPSINDEVPRPQQPFQMMVVVDVQLPFSGVELQKIKARVPTDCLVELGSSDAPSSSVDAICSHLQSASIVHFACHGVQDTSDPLASSLLVEDGRLSIAKIMQQSVPSGSLAFLCACETGMGDMNIPDEAMSVGVCLLFSGYRSVVATMWEIADTDGPTVADVFYEELLKGSDGKPSSQPDMNRSALALHVAIQKLSLSGTLLLDSPTLAFNWGWPHSFVVVAPQQVTSNRKAFTTAVIDTLRSEKESMASLTVRSFAARPIFFACIYILSSDLSRHKVVVTRDLGPEVMSLLRNREGQDIDLVLWDKEEPCPREWFLKNVPGASALVVLLSEKIDAELLDAAGPQLRVVSTMSVGYEHLDLKELAKRNIKIGYTPDVLTDAVADITVMLALMAGRNARETMTIVNDGKWPDFNWGPFLFCGPQLSISASSPTRTAGFIGFGRIAQATLARLISFGFTHCVYTSSPSSAPNPTRDARLAEAHSSLRSIRRVDLTTLAQESDVVFVLAPGGAATQNIVDEAFLRKMKKTAVLVNTSRGTLVDSDALAKALRERWIWGAGLDVVKGEPGIAADHPLVKEPRCTILPHIGSATFETRVGMATLAVQNALAAIFGQEMPAALDLTRHQ